MTRRADHAPFSPSNWKSDYVNTASLHYPQFPYWFKKYPLGQVSASRQYIIHSRTRYIARNIDPEYSLATHSSFINETPCINTHPVCSSYLLNIFFSISSLSQHLLFENRKVPSIPRDHFSRSATFQRIMMNNSSPLNQVSQYHFAILAPFYYACTICKNISIITRKMEVRLILLGDRLQFESTQGRCPCFWRSFQRDPRRESPSPSS